MYQRHFASAQPAAHGQFFHPSRVHTQHRGDQPFSSYLFFLFLFSRTEKTCSSPPLSADGKKEDRDNPSLFFRFNCCHCFSFFLSLFRLTFPCRTSDCSIFTERQKKGFCLEEENEEEGGRLVEWRRGRRRKNL
jgi:hypothetical protein